MAPPPPGPTLFEPEEEIRTREETTRDKGWGRSTFPFLPPQSSPPFVPVQRVLRVVVLTSPSPSVATPSVTPGPATRPTPVSTPRSVSVTSPTRGPVRLPSREPGVPFTLYCAKVPNLRPLTGRIYEWYWSTVVRKPFCIQEQVLVGITGEGNGNRRRVSRHGSGRTGRFRRKVGELPGAPGVLVRP